MLRPEPRPASQSRATTPPGRLQPPPGPEPTIPTHARAPPAPHDPRGHDAHHPGVPLLARSHHRRGRRLLYTGGIGGGEDPHLGLAAVAIEQVELARDLAGARMVRREKKLERGVGALHATGGVDARAQPETKR